MPKHTPLSEEAKVIAEEFKEFTYTVSHDFSAPLRAIVEFSKLLRGEFSDELNEDGKLYLSMVIDNGVKMQRMLDGLLVYSRLNTEPSDLKWVDTDRVLEQCRAGLEDKWLLSPSKLAISSLPKVYGDKKQLERLFNVLLKNAFTFHEDGKFAEVSLVGEEKETECHFTLSDNGIGMDPTHSERIFEPFQRLHGDDEFPGIGMGLTVAKKIIQLHGGRIWIDSAKGKGTRIHFSLLKPEGTKSV